MGLNKYKIGDLVQIVDERNTKGIRDFFGININKEFMPTVANVDGVNEKRYKIVRKGRFVFSGMQTGRDECIRIALYLQEKPIIVSPAYITFEISAVDKILPDYFFMLFLSKEKDRLGWFYSDSSVRANLDWEVFASIELNVPNLEIQQKYVAVYRSMLANRASFERGLDDLKLVCDAALDQIKKKAPRVQTGDLLETVDIRNAEGKISKPSGINVTKRFMPSVASVEEENLKNYKIVRKGQFAYSSMQTGRDDCIRIAFHDDDADIIVSPAYSVLRIKNESVLAEYVMTWFSRSESDRYGSFASDASIRANLDIERFFEIEIPLPALEVQRSIVEIYKVYKTRHKINGQLKALGNQICPILIKGSIEEAQKGTSNGILF